MQTAAYVRVSTAEQDVQRQINELEERFKIDDWYRDVSTGTTMQRDGLNDLLDDLTTYDRIIFDEVSRLGRTASDMRDRVKEGRENGVEFVFRDSGLTLEPKEDDTRAHADLIFDILSHLAQEESQRLSRRINSGIKKAKKEGKHMGKPPLGYEVDEDGFLVESEPMYSKINSFIRDVNKGKAKKPTARFYGINPNSAQNVLEQSTNAPPQYEDPYYDAEYVGDEEWKKQRAEFEHRDES